MNTKGQQSKDLLSMLANIEKEGEILSFSVGGSVNYRRSKGLVILPTPSHKNLQKPEQVTWQQHSKI